jgi:hypothetical protein
MFPDGTYDVIVVDAEPGEAAGTVLVDLAIAAGDHRGEIVTVTAAGLGRDPLDLLAVPGTLVVTDGEPDLLLEG